MDDLDDERAIERRGLVGFKLVEHVGGTNPRGEDAVRQLDRPGARAARIDDPLPDAAQVLDHDQPQQAGHRPQLADRQRRDFLIRPEEQLEQGRVEAAVGMGHEGPGDPVRARVIGERAADELGKDPVVPWGQRLPDLDQLLVDDVEIVDQPFGGGGDRAFLLDFFGEGAIGVEERAGVVLEAIEEPRAFPGRPGVDAVRAGQRLGVLREPLRTEDLPADGLQGRRSGSADH